MLLQAQAIGRLGGDPQTHSGDRWQVVSFSMATSHRKDETIWITVKAWGKLAELLADK
ncbi:MAG: single-stranded DNA-binding protein, partial [Chloroflexi bacterium]